MKLRWKLCGDDVGEDDEEVVVVRRPVIITRNRVCAMIGDPCTQEENSKIYDFSLELRSKKERKNRKREVKAILKERKSDLQIEIRTTKKMLRKLKRLHKEFNPDNPHKFDCFSDYIASLKDMKRDLKEEKEAVKRVLKNKPWRRERTRRRMPMVDA